MKLIRECVVLAGLSLALNISASTDLVKVSEVNPDIRYSKTRATSSDFYLVSEAAQKLSEAQKELKAHGLHLVVYEAYVPYSAHKKSVEMDSSVPDPEECLRHSCGMAVDVGLEKEDGTQLPMPTAFDVFGPEARPDYMDLSAETIEYRDMIKDVMERHGFKGSENVWYHFECIGCDTSCYLDVSFEDLA